MLCRENLTSPFSVAFPDPVQSIFQPTVMGVVEGRLRPLTAQEAEAFQFISHHTILTWEGLVENIDQPYAQVHLVDTDAFSGHDDYTQQVLGRGLTYTKNNFLDEVQCPQRRRYMPFGVFDFRDRPILWKGTPYRWVMKIDRYDCADTHQGLADMLVNLRRLLSDNLMQGFGDPLLFIHDKVHGKVRDKNDSFCRPHRHRLADISAVGFETITEQAITEQAMIEAASGTLVSALNPRAAMSYSCTHLTVPAIQPTHLLPIEFSTASEDDIVLSNIGANAANYAAIQKLFAPQYIKRGFALSFAHYQQIVAEPVTHSLIQSFLTHKDTLSPDEINQQLKRIRKSIQEKTSDANSADSLRSIRAIIEKMPIVERIQLCQSTNSEALPTFNDIDLYESVEFKVTDSDEHLKKKLLQVMASLWLERAFWERELFGVDHGAVGMAVLIHPDFSDEYASVAVMGSEEKTGFRTWVNAQKGEVSATHPLEDESSESFTFMGHTLHNIQVHTRSDLGNVFLSGNQDVVRSEFGAKLLQLRRVTQQLYDHFVAKQRDLDDRRKYGLYLECKLMKEGSEVMLYVKQGRLLNLDHEAEQPNASIVKAIAKGNGMNGAHLRRQPKPLSALAPEEFSLVQADSVVGINAFEDVGGGFVKLNVIIPSSSCPAFRGEMYVLREHFNFI